MEGEEAIAADFGAERRIFGGSKNCSALAGIVAPSACMLGPKLLFFLFLTKSRCQVQASTKTQYLDNEINYLWRQPDKKLLRVICHCSLKIKAGGVFESYPALCTLLALLPFWKMTSQHPEPGVPPGLALPRTHRLLKPPFSSWFILLGL